MTFTIDKFLKPINPGDKNIIIYDDNGRAIHTINPYSVINTFVNNNLLKISLASDRVITLNFITTDLAKSALNSIQERLEIFKNQNPIFIDKQIEKYVGEVIESQKKVVDNIIETANGKLNYVPHWMSATALSATGSIWDDGNSVKIGFTNSSGLIPFAGKSLLNIQSNLSLPSTFSLANDNYFNSSYGPCFSTVRIEGVNGGLSSPRVIAPPAGYPVTWITDDQPLTKIVGSGYGTSLVVDNVSPYLLRGQLTNPNFRTGGVVSGPSIVTHFKGTDPVYIWEHANTKRLRLESTSGKWDFWSEAIIPGIYNEISFQNSGGTFWEFIVTATAATGSNVIPHTFANYSILSPNYLMYGETYVTYSLVPKNEISNIITFSSVYNIASGMIITGTKRDPSGNNVNIFPSNTRISTVFPDGQTVQLTNAVSYTFSTTDLLTLSGPILTGTRVIGAAYVPPGQVGAGSYYGSQLNTGLLRQLRKGEKIYLQSPKGTVYFGGGVGIGRSVWNTSWALNVRGLSYLDSLQTAAFKLNPTASLTSNNNILVGDNQGNASWLPASSIIGNGFTGTSSTQLTIGTVGSYFQIKTQPYLSFSPGQVVVVYDQLGALYVTQSYMNGFGSNKIIAEIDGYSFSGGTMSLVTLYAQNVGSASNNWQIALSGAVGPQGPAGFGDGTFSVTGDIIPALDYTYNLGSPTNRWNNIYVKDALVASQSIYLGDLKISSEDSVVKANDRAVNKYEGTSSTPYTIGVIGEIVTFQTNTSLSYLKGDSIKVQNQLKNFYEEVGYSEESIHANFLGMVDLYEQGTGRIDVILTYTEHAGFYSDSWLLKLNSDTIGFENDLSNNLKYLKVIGTSSTEMSIPQVGYVREFYTQLDLGFYAGQELIVYNEFFNNYEDPEYVDGDSNYFIGKVDFYYPETGLLTVVADYSVGSGTYSSWQITVSSLPGLGTTASFDELTVTGPTNIQQVIEVLTTATAVIAGSPSTFNLDFDNGSIFYIEPEGDNFVANYLNVPTTDNRIISTTIVISQTASAYIPNLVAINGDIIPISWANGSLPSGNANQTDIVGFSFMRIGATWSKVFGQLSTFTTI